MKTRETPAFTSTKEQLSKEKHPFNSKAGSASLFAPPDPSSPAGRVWETLEAWSRHEFLADASEDDWSPLGPCSFIHSLISSVVYNHQCVLTGGRRSCSILFAFRLPSVIPTNLIPLGFAPFRWRAGKGEFCALVSAWAQIPFLAEGHFWTRHMTKWIQEPAGHFCYLSKHDLCQIQHQKPLRSILLTDVSTHKDNLSLFLI